MPKSKNVSVETNVKDKIEYIGLNFERVPKTLIATEKLRIRTSKMADDERQYKQYRFINIDDIIILLTPKHRMDSLRERIEEAEPLYKYLDSKSEENAPKYATFLKMLKKIDIVDIEKVSAEQEMLSEELPYKVKYNGNYLWQIYYSEELDKYFMLVPTEDSDYSTFFYLLKKKIENKSKEMIYVPISHLEYSTKFLKKSEIKDLENYLWLFTKDYPAIYEVTNKEQKETLQIVGETPVFGRIKTLYKMVFKNSKEASKFFKLLKALFILQVELPHYFTFETKINKNAEIELYLDEEQIKYESLLEFVSSNYSKSVKLKDETETEIERLSAKLKELKKEATKLEQEYLEKEKVISTFLECKKTFFGKVKYYFKLGKSAKMSGKKENKTKNEEKIIENKTKRKSVVIESRNYTLDELLISYKELESVQNQKKNLAQDINAIKLKNKNLKKKIENATSYINEINKHKKSIFEFWKYSNKDEVAALEEGEEEEVNISKIEKTFDYDSDFESFGENIDKSQRTRFTDSELDSSFIASTYLLDAINDIYVTKEMELKDFSEIVKELKEQKESFLDEQGEDFDIFGSYSRAQNKESNLGNKTHRESRRDLFDILEVQKFMKGQELKKSLTEAVKDIKRALKKNSLDEDLYVYCISEYGKEFKGFQLVSLNEEKEINDYLQKYNEEKIDLYKIKLSKGTNYIAMSNIIFYNNKNMTLPVGMQESNKILIDANEMTLKEIDKKEIKIQKLENEKDDFSEPVLISINVINCASLI